MAPTKRPVLHHVKEAGVSISGYRQFLQELAEPALGSDGRVLDPGDVWVEGQLLSTKELSIGWTEHIGDVAQFVKQVENRTGIEIQRVIGTPSRRISPADPILLGDMIKQGIFDQQRFARTFERELGGTWQVGFGPFEVARVS